MAQNKEAKKTIKKTEVIKTEGKVGHILKGRVVSAKLLKTATVLVERIKTHPLYKKSYKQSKKYLVHDELGVKPGDLVEISQIRPMSKNKHYQIVKVVGKDIEAIVIEELKEQALEEIARVMPEEAEKPEDQIEEKQVKKIKEKKEGKK